MTSSLTPDATLKWDAAQYLQFAEERTRPCRELAARVAIAAPRKIIDLGCGPGNSTQVLAERWPGAELTGLDSSSDMIDAARRTMPEPRWVVSGIAEWAAAVSSPLKDSPLPLGEGQGEGRFRVFPASGPHPNPPLAGEGASNTVFQRAARDSFDVIFSNAALQWVPDHATLFPMLLEHLAPGGALAVQMPNNIDAPAHRAAQSLAASSSWRDRFPAAGVRQWHVHAPEFYYDLVAPHVERIDLWETEYVQVMQGAEAILEWYKGTGLRPYFAELASATDREKFAASYLDAIRVAYPRRPDGRVLFPFRRLFLVAYVNSVKSL